MIIDCLILVVFNCHTIIHSLMYTRSIFTDKLMLISIITDVLYHRCIIHHHPSCHSITQMSLRNYSAYDQLNTNLILTATHIFDSPEARAFTDIFNPNRIHVIHPALSPKTRRLSCQSRGRPIRNNISIPHTSTQSITLYCNCRRHIPVTLPPRLYPLAFT